MGVLLPAAARAQARLVCRAWQTALAPVFTELCLGPGMEELGVGTDELVAPAQLQPDAQQTASGSHGQLPSPVALVHQGGARGAFMRAPTPPEHKQQRLQPILGRSLGSAFPAAATLTLVTSSSREYPPGFAAAAANAVAALPGLTLLTVLELHEVEDLYDDAGQPSAWDALRLALPALAGRLRVLHVTSCFWREPDSFALLGRLRQLQELRLRSVPLEHPSEIEVLASMTRLTALEFGVYYDGASAEHGVPAALQSLSALCRLHDLALPIWRRSLGGDAHPLAPALAAALVHLTGLEALEVDGRFGYLTAVSRLTGLTRLASATPLTAAGWQAISRLPKLRSLGSLTPLSTPPAPPRGPAGGDLALLAARSVLTVLDAHIGEPRQLAALSSLTALSRLTLRATREMTEAEDARAAVAALHALPRPQLRSLRLYWLLPPMASLLSPLAAACCGLEELVLVSNALHDPSWEERVSPGWAGAGGLGAAQTLGSGGAGAGEASGSACEAAQLDPDAGSSGASDGASEALTWTRDLRLFERLRSLHISTRRMDPSMRWSIADCVLVGDLPASLQALVLSGQLWLMAGPGAQHHPGSAEVGPGGSGAAGHMQALQLSVSDGMSSGASGGGGGSSGSGSSGGDTGHEGDAAAPAALAPAPVVTRGDPDCGAWASNGNGGVGGRGASHPAWKRSRSHSNVVQLAAPAAGAVDAGIGQLQQGHGGELPRLQSLQLRRCYASVKALQLLSSCSCGQLSQLQLLRVTDSSQYLSHSGTPRTAAQQLQAGSAWMGPQHVHTLQLHFQALQKLSLSVDGVQAAPQGHPLHGLAQHHPGAQQQQQPQQQPLAQPQAPQHPAGTGVSAVGREGAQLYRLLQQCSNLHSLQLEVSGHPQAHTQPGGPSCTAPAPRPACITPLLHLLEQSAPVRLPFLRRLDISLASSCGGIPHAAAEQLMQALPRCRVHLKPLDAGSED